MSRFPDKGIDNSFDYDFNKVIIVQNLSFNVRSSHLNEIFSNFGKVQVDMGYIKGHCAGVALIKFDKHSQALEAISKMNSGNIDGLTISVGFADPQKSIDDYIRLYHSK